jgi:RNA polymerase sigma factor (sigma-70 family)
MHDGNQVLNRTRTTLIKRLKNWQDQASWQRFYDAYSMLIFRVARGSGLTETEAEEVLQETMISVAKHMPNFEYDRRAGSFKSWLLNMTRWRITDQLRRRGPRWRDPLPSEGHLEHDRTLENIPDGTHLKLEAVWETEWKKSLSEAAFAKVKRTLDPLVYQLFDVYVNRQWEPEKVAQKFRVTVGQVYKAKHRVVEAVKEEIDRLVKMTI